MVSADFQFFHLATLTHTSICTFGVCAMSKKARSKPMRSILTKLTEIYEAYFEILMFVEDMIVNEPIERWPVCDVLISFHSKDFPMSKTIDYIKFRGIWAVNDLERACDLLDRVRVYKIVARHGIAIPRHKVLWRDANHPNEGELEEYEDHIIVNGVTFNKPFVEKPVSAEDHNIRIYFPSTAGGGSQHLFRKTNNRSSIYSSESGVRREGSFIYEDFMPTDGTDVKVYAVGPDYAHAEARKSPGLDGKVDRDAEGKEVRYPVILSSYEKLIARKIVWAFRQMVCGFDLLRANGKSYVCDVNGFSFVKTSSKYYEDSARILGNMILRRKGGVNAPTFQLGLDEPPLVHTTYGTMMELRCVLAVIRHGDRTPKQKLKMEVRHQKFWELFRKHNGYQTGELKLKKPQQLQEVLDSARYLLVELNSGTPEKQAEIHENKTKLEQLKTVLEMYGHFSGINRKIQIRYKSNGCSKMSKKSSDTDQESKSEPSLILIVKWGGELTDAGKRQAEELGKAFRCLYPGGGQYGADSRGLGFLRLHSTYRHDLKMYASEEGRVQMTAAAFAKGLLALEGELTPILVQMVKSAHTDGLLDDDKDSRQYQSAVKKFLHEYFQQDEDFTEDDLTRLNPTHEVSVAKALQFISNPRKMCERIHHLVEKFSDMIARMRREGVSATKHLYCDETWDLTERRWNKLVKDFKHSKADGVFYDISKIPDIYDCIKYDLEHNFRVFNIEDMEELYVCSKYMADFVIPQEYGITIQEKLLIGQGICTPLLKKLQWDLKRCIEGNAEDENLTRLDPRASEGIATPCRHVRTRLYFTSESHIHSLVNLLRFGGLVSHDDKQWRRANKFISSITEFNYMSQLVIMLYEDTSKDADSDQRFHVELHFSPGALHCLQTSHVPSLGYRPKSRENSDQKAQSPFSMGVTMPLATLENIAEGKTDQESTDTTTVYSDEESAAAVKPDLPVNIVSIDNAGSRPITTEELKQYTPMSSPKLKHKLTATSRTASFSPPPAVLADDSCASNQARKAHAHSAEGYKKMSDPGEVDLNNYNANVAAYRENMSGYSGAQRQRMSYAGFRHHTVNIMTQSDSKFISTAVISGTLRSNEDKQQGSVPALLTTAVLGRGASEPNLQYYTINSTEQKDNIGTLKDLEYFVPPLRSLETLHNQLSQKQVDEFLERVTTLKTPIPSPPRTPRQSVVCNAFSKDPASISKDCDQTSNVTVDYAALRLKRFMTEDYAST